MDRSNITIEDSIDDNGLHERATRIPKDLLDQLRDLAGELINMQKRERALLGSIGSRESRIRDLESKMHGMAVRREEISHLQAELRQTNQTLAKSQRRVEVLEARLTAQVRKYERVAALYQRLSGAFLGRIQIKLWRLSNQHTQSNEDGSQP